MDTRRSSPAGLPAEDSALFRDAVRDARPIAPPARSSEADAPPPPAAGAPEGIGCRDLPLQISLFREVAIPQLHEIGRLM